MMVDDNQGDSIVTNNDILQSVNKQSKSQYAQTICFILIVIMNLSAWIDLYGVFVQLPLMIPLTPEGWTLPSLLSMCICIANIMPAIVIFMRWHQGKRFSEIPYIYIIISVGIISCCILALFWRQTMFLFGRERSVVLLVSVFALSMLDCTSSLVFFDYIKRFRPQYLTAIFLGEGLTGAIPTLLLLIQGIGSETICVQSGNGTTLVPTFTQPRFSVTVFMFLIAGIILASLIAFILLQWTNIISLANAAEPAKLKENPSKTTSDDDADENVPMTSTTESSKPSKQRVVKPFIFLLCLSTFSSFILYGILPSITTYSLLPYGQKTLYYYSLLNPLAYSVALLLSLRWTIISIRMTVQALIFGCILAVFIIVIAAQSPCPWWADSSHGAVIIVSTQCLLTTILGYVRITIGNHIKTKWSNEKGMFYFGATVQIGSLIGTIPMYLLVNIFNVFIDRKPCQIYCLTSK